MNWINVKERLPEKSGLYLVYLNDTNVDEMYFDIGYFDGLENFFSMIDSYNITIVTHWMYVEDPV